MTQVWIAKHEWGVYSSYGVRIIGVYTTRALAKAASIAAAEQQAIDESKNNADYLARRRHDFGLDDYRWFDSASGSRFGPSKPPVRLVDAKGRIAANVAEVDYRNDWLYVIRYDLIGPTA